MSQKNFTGIFIDENWQSTKALAAAIDKLKSIDAELAGLERDLEMALSEKRKLLNDPRRALFDDEAAAYLVGEAPPSLSSVDDKIKNIRHKRDVVALARDKQQQVVADLRGKFSVEVCKHPKNIEAYLAVERGIVEAVKALAEANEDERRFLSALYDVGCSSVPFRPMRIRQVGDLADPNSLASMALREFKEYFPELF